MSGYGGRPLRPMEAIIRRMGTNYTSLSGDLVAKALMVIVTNTLGHGHVSTAVRERERSVEA